MKRSSKFHTLTLLAVWHRDMRLGAKRLHFQSQVCFTNCVNIGLNSLSLFKKKKYGIVVLTEQGHWVDPLRQLALEHSVIWCNFLSAQHSPRPMCSSYVNQFYRKFAQAKKQTNQNNNYKNTLNKNVQVLRVLSSTGHWESAFPQNQSRCLY